MASQIMKDQPKSLLFFHAPQQDGHRLLIESTVGALKAEGYEVHVLTSGSEAWVRTLEVCSHKVPIPRAVSSGLLFHLVFLLLAPFSLLLISWTTRVRSLVVFSPFFALLSVYAIIFARLRPSVVLECVPWAAYSERNISCVRRVVLTLLSQLGIFVCRRVIISTNAGAREISDAIPAARITALSFAIEQANNDEEALNDSDLSLTSLFELPEDSIVVGMYDPLYTKEGIEMLLRSVSATEDPRFSVILFSEGPRRSEAESIAVSLGLHSRFRCSEDISYAMPFAEHCDIFVISPKLKAVTPWTLQLLATENILLAPNYSGYKELLKHEEFLFENDDVELLSSMLRACVEDLDSKKRALNLLKKERSECFVFSYPPALIEALEST